MWGSLLAYFHLCLVSVLFPGPSLTEMKLYKKIFFLVCVLFLGVLTTFEIEDGRLYCAGDEHFWCGGQTCFALVLNALVLETNALKMHV